MLNFKISKLLIIFLLFGYYDPSNAQNSNCNWDNKAGPCLVINSSIPNASRLNSESINRIIITKKDINNIGATDIVGVLETIPELSITRSGPIGQQTSVFFRGTNSNHTLVMINGVPINDQSTTQGLHDFGVDFIQTVQQIEVFPGSTASHFGSNAIGGAINIILSGDYQDKIEYNFDKDSNYDILANKTIQNGNHDINIKLATTKNKLISARKSTSNEKDEVKNYTGNLNYKTWIKNINLFNTTYIRQTITEYDNSAVNQIGYKGDNKMITTQFGAKHKTKDEEKNALIYYNGYDREYNEIGTLDNYYSNTIGIKLNLTKNFKNIISYGYGLDYKNDWGNFDNRGSYTASTKGNTDNTAIHGNLGIKLKNKKNFSLFLRSDDHKFTGRNNTYAADLNKELSKQIKIGIARKTGIRNPTLYELFGTDNFGYSGNRNLRPEKSLTNEIYSEYKINNHSRFKISAFRSSIKDNIEYLSNKYINDTDNIDLTQRGVNFNYNLNSNNYSLKFFTSLLESKNKKNQAQLRRPKKNYGININNKINTNLLGQINFNIQYKHYGKHFDTHSSTFNRIEMDSTDLVNLGIKKKISNKSVYVRINNLLDEKYQRPHGYNQTGRLLNFGIKIIN